MTDADTPSPARASEPQRMKMVDVRVGMRLVSTIAGGPAFSPITVTEITKRGFRYKLDAPVCLHPLMGTTEGGEHFGHDGECFYTPEHSRPAPQAPGVTPEELAAALVTANYWSQDFDGTPGPIQKDAQFLARALLSEHARANAAETELQNLRLLVITRGGETEKAIEERDEARRLLAKAVNILEECRDGYDHSDIVVAWLERNRAVTGA